MIYKLKLCPILFIYCIVTIVAHIEVKLQPDMDPKEIYDLATLKFETLLDHERSTPFEQSWDKVKRLLRFDYCSSGGLYYVW